MCRLETHRSSRCPGRIALCAILFIFAGAVSDLGAHDLITTDGLTVQVDDAGQVTGVQVAGDELLTTGITGGFTLTDYTGLSGPNVLANAGFEGGFTHWGDDIYVPDNWNLVTATGSATNIMLQADTAAPYEGVNALRFVTTQSGRESEPLEPDVLEVASDLFAVEPDAIYYCSSVCRSDHGYGRDVNAWPYEAKVYLDWYDGSQVLLSSVKVFGPQQTYYNWTQFTGWGRSPATAAFGAVRVYIKGNIESYSASYEILFDDLRCFREPSGVRDIPVSSTVTNTAGVLDLLAVNVGGRGLDISARMEALDDRIEVSGQVTITEGATIEDKALDLSFVLPVDTSSLLWFWYDYPHKSFRMRDQYVYDEVVAADSTSPNLKLNTYNLSCITDGAHVLNFGRDPDVVRPFYVQYEAAEDLYIIRFQLGMAPERAQAGFDFVIYTSPPNCDFRGALQDYYDIYPGYGRLRQLGGQPMTGGINGGRPNAIIDKPFGINPEDFAVRFYFGSDASDAEYLTDTLGLKMLYYIFPWNIQYETDDSGPAPPYVEFRNAVNDQPSVFWEEEMIPSFPSDHLINSNDTTGQDYLIYRVTHYTVRNAYQYMSSVYINTEDADPSFGDRYLDHLESVYQYFQDTMLSEDYLYGVMMDLTNIGSSALDGTRSRFVTAGYDLTYSPATFKPALWNLNAYQAYLRSMKSQLAATRSDHDIIVANMTEYGTLFSAANLIDTFGFECSPITGWNWSTKHLDYRKIVAGSKPFSPVITHSEPLVFDEPSNEYYKGMTDMYNVALLYGIYIDPHKFTNLNNKDLEELRSLSAGVTPFIDDFMVLGWNPNHRVNLVDESDQPITDKYLLTERYGPSDQFDGGETAYVVLLYNHTNLKFFDTIFPRPGTQPETKDFRLKINLNDIGMTEPVTLEEMSVSMHDMAPVVPPALSLTNNGDGTVTITGTVAWRDSLVLKLKEYIPDTTPPAVPTGVAATVILP